MSVNSQATGSITQEDGSLHARSMSVSLTVKDLQKSLAWYHEVVGFSIDRKMERDGKLRAVALKAGEVRITINQDYGAKGWERIKGLGFSIQISTDQNVDDIAQRIKRLGGTLESEPADMPWGVRMMRLLDPDGFKLSISMPLTRQGA
jgi:lactoylglutathione lyase